MTNEQEAHLERIKASFELKVDSKYRLGQEEHGGNLIDTNAIDLIDMAIAEAIDMVVYLETLREVLEG